MSPLTRSLRLTALILANMLLPISVLIFGTGFFPYKPFLPGLATFEDVLDPGEALVSGEHAKPVFDRVVFMVVDALRSDFVFGEGSGFEFVQSLINDGAAIPFTAHATPPTVTMPRVKALTTGSVPSFLDLILNFAESDTTSSLSAQDTWLAQLREARNGSLVFYGDDTWLKLYPDTLGEVGGHERGEEKPFWLRHDGTSSFFVSDFTEVDNNVTRHIPTELAHSDWNAMILHYLGLDHIGHKTGPQGPNMLPKQREMDDIVRMIFEAMEREAHLKNTLLVLAGDHGMNAGGNHGGSGPGETEPAMVFASPEFRSMIRRRVYECPALPKAGTEFHYYTKIGQSDLVPTLAGLLGMPVSKNSLGILIGELMGVWGEGERLRLMRRNARQLLHIVKAKYGAEWFDGRVGVWTEEMRGRVRDNGTGGEVMEPDSDGERLAFLWAGLALNRSLDFDALTKGEAEVAESAYYRFLLAAQETMSDTASSYDIPRMVLGIGLTGVALVLALLSFSSLWPPSTAGSFFSLTVGLHAAMMFASSYVEEEQRFWYWVTPVWIVMLAVTKLREAYRADTKPMDTTTTTRRTLTIALSALALLTTHRLSTRWNQTGQKYAGSPDIVHTFFPSHHKAMWLLILATYLLNGYLLHQRSFRGLFMREFSAFFTTALFFLGVVFKLNFTQADAPELVGELAGILREWSEPFSLVLQARGVFAVLGLATLGVMGLSLRRKGQESEDRRVRDEEEEEGDNVSLVERLHHLLTLFLMTQTRAPNIPLFMFMEIQRAALGVLLPGLATTTSFSPAKSALPPHRALPVALTTLLLSHTLYFCIGGSNSISSIDLSNAYNGVADYNVGAVGLLLFVGNWAGGVWWVSAGVLLLRGQQQVRKGDEDGKGDSRRWVEMEREKLRQDAMTIAATSSATAQNTLSIDHNPDGFRTYLSTLTFFIASSLIAVMAACTILRTHLFIWTVFSPKYLYAMAWAVGWHLGVNVGFGGMLWGLGG